MPNLTTPVKRPKPFRRAGFVRRTWYGFRQLPYYVTIGATFLLFNGALITGYFVNRHFEKSREYKENNARWLKWDKAANAGDEVKMKEALEEIVKEPPANGDRKAHLARWAKFEAAAQAGDEEAMKEALEELVKKNPQMRIAALRLIALETGDADPSDGQMAMLTVQKHLRASPPRWPEAEREARKCLEHYPKDWRTRCVAAQAALIRKDLPAAIEELDQLPDLGKEDVNVDPIGLIYAFVLFAETRRDPAPLRQFITTRVIDRIRSPDTKSWPLAQRLAIIDCYVRAFDPEREGKQLDGLNRAVAPLGEFVESCVLEAIPAKDETSLVRLGNLCGQLGMGFALLQKDHTLTSEQYAAISKDLSDRCEKIWRAVVEINPKSVAGYKGLAIAELRRKNPDAARATIAEGLKQCGDEPELLAFYSQLLRANSNTKESVRVLARAALKDPTNLQLWLQLAEAAGAAGEMPIVGEAVENAQKLAPDDPRTIRAGAWLALENKNPLNAFLLLNKFDRAILAKDATLARWYVQAMIDGAMTSKLPDFLRVVEEEAIRANQPAPMAAALKAINEADYFDLGATKSAIAQVERLLQRWPDHLDLMTVQAMAYYRIAEHSEPRWELAATKNAIRALERLRAKAPENADIAAAMVWLKLKGEKNAANQALLSASVLVDLRKHELPMSGWQMRVLGEVYLANNRADDAIAVLEKARASGGGTPSILIPLSLAYYKAMKWDESIKYIRIVQSQPRSPQEQTDYIEAVSIIKP
jgi:predicted Zn-dependent protease